MYKLIQLLICLKVLTWYSFCACKIPAQCYFLSPRLSWAPEPGATMIMGLFIYFSL